MNDSPLSVKVAAPCRVDLAGGTLDIWPIGLIHPGSRTVNIAIPVEIVLVADLAGEPGEVCGPASTGSAADRDFTTGSPNG